jgi:hypothetical protein
MFLKNLLSGIAFLVAQETWACVDFTGYFGGAGNTIRIEQRDCNSITIFGHEPGTGWGMSTGKNQPVDGQFHDFKYQDGGMGNYQPLLPIQPSEKPRLRVRVSRSHDSITLEVQNNIAIHYLDEPQWTEVKKGVFSFDGGRLKYVASGKNWSGQPFESINFNNRNDVYIICEKGPSSATEKKFLLVRDSVGLKMISVAQLNSQQTENGILKVEDYGSSQGFVFIDQADLKATLIADIEHSTSAVIERVAFDQLGGKKLTRDIFGCYKGQGYRPF